VVNSVKLDFHVLEKIAVTNENIPAEGLNLLGKLGGWGHTAFAFLWYANWLPML